MSRFKKTRYMKLVEKVVNMDIDAFLKQEYLEYEKTLDQISEEYDIPKATLHKWMIELDIPRRVMKFSLD